MSLSWPPPIIQNPRLKEDPVYKNLKTLWIETSEGERRMKEFFLSSEKLRKESI